MEDLTKYFVKLVRNWEVVSNTSVNYKLLVHVNYI